MQGGPYGAGAGSWKFCAAEKPFEIAQYVTTNSADGSTIYLTAGKLDDQIGYTNCRAGYQDLGKLRWIFWPSCLVAFI